MEIFLVGGAVRDELLGLEPKDKDYVVVGSTPEEMLNAGFTQVGADFPVFLHPTTGEEYALARKEFKEGNGYAGFKVAFGPEVTLEEDLARRDLTINAMAKDVIHGKIYDPYGGQRDLERKLLRPTTEAFSEDPVRALRAARFLARYPDFRPHYTLRNAVNSLYDLGELDHLVPERVWLETRKALSEIKPGNYFRFLSGYGIFPELDDMIGVEEHNKWHPEDDVFEHIMLSIDAAAELSKAKSKSDRELAVFGTLCHDFGKPKAYSKSNGTKSTKHELYGVPIVDLFCDKWKVPNEFRRIGLLSAELHTHSHICFEMKPKTIQKLLSRFRDLTEFNTYLTVAIADKSGRGEPANEWPYPQPEFLMECWDAMHSIDRKEITSKMKPGPQVGEAIRHAQVAAISSIDKTPYKEPYDAHHRSLSTATTISS